MPLSPILIESLCNLTCSLLNTKAPIIVTVSIIVTKCSPQPELKTSSCLPLTSAVDDQCIQSHCFVKQLCLQSHAVLYSFSHCRCSCSHFSLRRGVRSDAQLSSTETRFQKCSQSGKNGSKHPMLSISMAYNVISCKKVERNTQKLKIADFTM